MRSLTWTLIFIASLPSLAWSATATPSSADTMGAIRDATVQSDWAWQQLQTLTDTVGARLSGSPGLSAAVQRVEQATRSLGARVTLQKVMVPHWVRGREEAAIINYVGKPVGLSQPVHITALGGSAATSTDGLTAPVLIVKDLEEWPARAAEARGKIVLFTSRFNQRQAENGNGLNEYLLAGQPRFNGPSAANAAGAAAVLVRSVGGANYRLPHTGGTHWAADRPAFPVAAIAAEDSDLIERLARTGPVKIRMLLTPQTLPDAESHNVIADWVGRERPEELVIVSGHLDSWDLATGAIDDGMGVISSAAVIEVLSRLNLHARRTIRFIAWTNEENGGRGHAAYMKSVTDQLSAQFAAIESDFGDGAALGVTAAVTSEFLPKLQPVVRALAPIGATTLSRTDSEVGSDIADLQRAGVPGFAPMLESRHYFDYHHTAADTLDKVKPEDLKSQVATLAVLAYYLADMPGELPRFKVAP